MYSGVPASLASSSTKPLVLKSVSTTRPSPSRMTFCGLRSRCSTPARRTAARPRQTSTATPAASTSGSGPSLVTIA
jgi:hypothetical protein